MRRRVVLCVCLSVTMLAATYLVCMSKVRLRRVSCSYTDLYCVDFTENVLLNEIVLLGRYGVICLPR